MHLQIPFLVPGEDVDCDAWICADELPWDEPGDDSTSLFESIEPLLIFEQMPSERELLAMEIHTDNEAEHEPGFDEHKPCLVTHP